MTDKKHIYIHIKTNIKTYVINDNKNNNVGAVNG